MTFIEFHRAVRDVANGAYFSAQVQSTETAADCGARVSIEWSAYVASRGWTDKHKTSETCLADLRAMPVHPNPERQTDETPLEQIGDVAL